MLVNGFVRSSLLLALLGVTWRTNLILAQAPNHHTIRTALPDRAVQALVLNRAKVIRAKPDREYHWCIGQRIMATQGGYSGDLLDGAYVEYHENGQLMTKGNLSNGLRSGVWLEWDEKGRLLRSTGWKEGRKHGRSLVMDTTGNEPIERHYRRGKLIETKEDKEKREADHEKPAAQKPEQPPKDAKDRGMSKRMRVREEQNKGTKEQVVRNGKKRKKEQPVPEVP